MSDNPQAWLGWATQPAILYIKTRSTRYVLRHSSILFGQTYRVRGSIWTPCGITTLHHSTEITLPCVQTDRTLANSNPSLSRIIQYYGSSWKGTKNVFQIRICTILTDVRYRFGTLLTRLPAAQLCPGFEYQRLFFNGNSDENSRKDLNSGTPFCEKTYPDQYF